MGKNEDIGKVVKIYPCQHPSDPMDLEFFYIELDTNRVGVGDGMQLILFLFS